LESPTTYSEEQLVILLQQKSREGFNYLYGQYSAVLFGVIKRIISTDDQSAQDVLQEVFFKIWNNIGQYNNEKGRLYTWMLNIARNSAIDKLRSKGEIMKSKILAGEDIVDTVVANVGTEQKTDAIGLRTLVGALRPEQSIIIELAYYKGFTMEEIAKELDVPVGTVKTRMRAAIKLLRQHFIK
jgi:RNA polymerase sigma-70 factor (ECF subfamily)